MQIGWKWTVLLLATGLLCGAVGCGGGGGNGGNGGDGGTGGNGAGGGKEPRDAHGQQGQPGQAAGGTAVTTDSGEKVSFAVHGMHCEGCVSVITKALQERDGVMANQVSLADSVAVVTYDPQKVAPADLKVLIEDLGYTVAEKI